MAMRTVVERLMKHLKITPSLFGEMLGTPIMKGEVGMGFRGSTLLQRTHGK